MEFLRKLFLKSTVNIAFLEKIYIFKIVFMLLDCWILLLNDFYPWSFNFNRLLKWFIFNIIFWRTCRFGSIAKLNGNILLTRFKLYQGEPVCFFVMYSLCSLKCCELKIYQHLIIKLLSILKKIICKNNIINKYTMALIKIVLDL